jgi:deoxyribose-phosphate aldolase
MTAAAVADRAILAVSLLDLTSLGDDDTEERIAALCRRAAAPGPGLPPAAAVCVLPRFVRFARSELGGSPVRVAAAAGDFPSGRAALSVRLAEVRRAVADGADEIDAPAAFARSPDDEAAREVAAIREACGSARLKVILETGALGPEARIRRAAEAAIAAGADFLKTSTGRIAPGATPEAARVLLECAAGSERKIGVKVSGGIRTSADAFAYMDLAEQIGGSGVLETSRFRIGASALLDDLASAVREGRR